MEIGYSAVSHANPMIQIVDMVAFTMKKWAEFEAGYRPDWPTAAIDFYCECRDIVWRRVEFKTLRFSKLSVPSQLVEYLKEVRSLQTALPRQVGHP